MGSVGGNFCVLLVDGSGSLHTGKSRAGRPTSRATGSGLLVSNSHSCFPRQYILVSSMYLFYLMSSK